jgi:hypothetical protein
MERLNFTETIMKIISILGVAAVMLLTGCKDQSKPSAPPAANNKPTISKSGADSETVLLAVKWDVGNRFVYRMDTFSDSLVKMAVMPEPMKHQVTMGQTFALDVGKELPDGKKEIVTEFLAQEMEVIMNGKTVMDFDSKSTEGKNDAMAETLRNIIGAKLTMIISPSNTLETVVGLDEWLAKIGGNDSQQKAMFQGTYNKEFFKRMVESGAQFPQGSVSKGREWVNSLEVPAGPIGTLIVTTTNTFVGWETRDSRKTAVIDFVGVLTSSSTNQSSRVEKGEMKGKLYFDPDLGQQVDMEMDQNLNVVMEMPGGAPNQQPGKSNPMNLQMRQKITSKLVELTKK